MVAHKPKNQKTNFEPLKYTLGVNADTYANMTKSPPTKTRNKIKPNQEYLSTLIKRHLTNLQNKIETPSLKGCSIIGMMKKKQRLKENNKYAVIQKVEFL